MSSDGWGSDNDFEPEVAVDVENESQTKEIYNDFRNPPKDSYIDENTKNSLGTMEKLEAKHSVAFALDATEISLDETTLVENSLIDEDVKKQKTDFEEKSDNGWEEKTEIEKSSIEFEKQSSLVTSDYDKQPSSMKPVGFGQDQVSIKPTGFGSDLKFSEPSGFDKPQESLKPTGFGEDPEKTRKKSSIQLPPQIVRRTGRFSRPSSEYGPSVQPPTFSGNFENGVNMRGFHENKGFRAPESESDSHADSVRQPTFYPMPKSSKDLRDQIDDKETVNRNVNSSASRGGGFGVRQASDKPTGFGGDQGFGNQEEIEKPAFGEHKNDGDNQLSSFGSNDKSVSENAEKTDHDENKSSLASNSGSNVGFGITKFGQKDTGFGNSSKSFGAKQSSFGSFGLSSGGGFGNANNTFGAKNRESSTSESFGDRAVSGFGNSNHRFGANQEQESFGSRGNQNRENGEQRDRGCYNCQEEGHISAQCPHPKKVVNCRRCKQDGHMQKDCQNEEVRTEPTEPCRRCNEMGHWARECPERPKDFQGNFIVPSPMNIKKDEDLFKDIVENNNIDYDQQYTVTMGNGPKLENMATFDDFKNLPEQVLSNLKLLKHTKPLAIQKGAFFPILHGKDVVACAHTGCGKTLAFLLPIITNLMEEDWSNTGVAETPYMPRCLIIAPTRELAIQTYHTSRQITFKTSITTSVVYGGTSRTENLQCMSNIKKLGILVATMGRLKDYIQSNDISLQKLKYVVLDEADRMVNMNDFGEEVQSLIGEPEERTAQVVLFSASFSEELRNGDMMKIVKQEFTHLEIDKFGTANKKIEQRVYQVDKEDKKTKLLELLGIETQTCSVLPDARVLKDKTLIFVNSKKYTDTLASFLTDCGVPSLPMHSAQSQQQREILLDEFNRGVKKVMVASNVCARGLNISKLTHVINYDMPGKEGFDEYVNRIGRTGRAGFEGESTAFFSLGEDREILVDLVNVIEEAGKVVPEWLLEMKNSEAQAAKAIDDNEEW